MHFPRSTFCPRCGGTGKLEYAKRFLFFWTLRREAPCVACGASGEVPVIRIRFHGGCIAGTEIDVTQAELGLHYCASTLRWADKLGYQQHYYKYRNLAGIRGEEILHADFYKSVAQ